ncbi:MAG: type II secretion system protein [Planctomycetes bacterium]|nr:type II secretion system protein [Planctomycetota bacterium]
MGESKELSVKTQIRKGYFTLLELILSIGILGVFLYTCSATLIATIETQDYLEENFSKERLKNIGWHILYSDLANTVGIYYLQTSNWEGPKAAKAKVDPKKASNKTSTAKKKKKPGKQVSKDELFLFSSEPGIDDPFLEIVVSRGRGRVSEEDAGIGFRKVKYYVVTHPGDDMEGQILLRTEEPWQESGQQGSDDDDDFEAMEFDLESDYRKYAVMENFDNMEFFAYAGTEWVEEWSSLEMGDLPLAIKINFTKMDPEEENDFDSYNDYSDDEYERIVPVPLSYQIVGEPEDEI